MNIETKSALRSGDLRQRGDSKRKMQPIPKSPEGMS